jgi:hypothetical protein
MKTHVLSKCLAGIALAAIAQVSALPIAQFNEADVAQQVTLRVAGSSSLDAMLELQWRVQAVAGGELCVPGSLDIYRSSDQLHRLAFCTASASLPAAIRGKRLAIFKASSDGSGAGIAPLLRSSSLVPFFQVPSGGGTLSGCPGVVIAASGVFAAHTRHDACDVLTQLMTPDIGLSDLEPDAFRSAFSPSLTATELSALTVQGIAALLYGVPVTQGLRDRLQALSFPPTSPCHPSNVAYSANAESEACMPNLTTAQLQSLMTGRRTSLCDFASPTTAGVNLCNVTTPSYATPLISNSAVFICRRTFNGNFADGSPLVRSSSVQIAYENRLVGQGCAAASPSFLTALADPSHTSESPTPADVIACLNAHDAGNRGAIGVLSTQFKPLAGDKWRFVRLNGYAPTLLNAAKSNYDFFSEPTMQWRAVTISGLPVLAGDQLTAATSMRQVLALPAILATLNSSLVQSFGDAGFLRNLAYRNVGMPAPIPPLNTGAGGAGDLRNNPTLLVSRAIGGRPNTCLPAGGAAGASQIVPPS